MPRPPLKRKRRVIRVRADPRVAIALMVYNARQRDLVALSAKAVEYIHVWRKLLAKQLAQDERAEMMRIRCEMEHFVAKVERAR